MNDTTRCHPRTLREAFGLSPEDAVAIHKYKTPAHRRFFFAFARWGWLWIFLSVLLLTGCDEMADKEADAANLRDALAQAQQDRTDLWTPERIERAGVAAGMVARALPNTVAEVK